MTADGGRAREPETALPGPCEEAWHRWLRDLRDSGQPVDRRLSECIGTAGRALSELRRELDVLRRSQ